MKITNLISVLAVVALLATAVAFGLDAPLNLTVDASGDPILLDWDDVIGATKYSVDLEGMVTFDYVDPIKKNGIARIIHCQTCWCIKPKSYCGRK